MSSILFDSPNTVAERLTGRDYISWSAISTYRSCPLRYFFRYCERLPEECVSASLVFGGAIHAAVQYWFEQLMAGHVEPDLDTQLDVYRDAWRERETAEVLFSKGDNANTLGALAERMLAAFRASQFARPAGMILGVEEQLRSPIIPGCPDVLARVDLIVDEGDALLVTDLKTARCRWTQHQAEDAAEQLLLYGELVNGMIRGRPVRLEFAVITKTKDPAVDRRVVVVDQRRIDQTRQTVGRVWRAIEGQHFYPSPSPSQCPTCEFREACRKWSG